MVVIDTRTNEVFVNVSKGKAAEIVGVNRSTMTRWRRKRLDDRTNKETYNYYVVYFTSKKMG